MELPNKFKGNSANSALHLIFNKIEEILNETLFFTIYLKDGISYVRICASELIISQVTNLYTQAITYEIDLFHNDKSDSNQLKDNVEMIGLFNKQVVIDNELMGLLIGSRVKIK